MNFPILIYNPYLNIAMSVNQNGYNNYVLDGQYSIATLADIQHLLHKD